MTSTTITAGFLQSGNEPSLARQCTNQKRKITRQRPAFVIARGGPLINEFVTQVPRRSGRNRSEHPSTLSILPFFRRELDQVRLRRADADLTFRQGHGFGKIPTQDAVAVIIPCPQTYRVTTGVANEASIAVSTHRFEIDARNTVGAANGNRSVHHVS